MALFLSCAIVGLTVMPHSLFLGSALVQPRLKEYDETHGTKANVLPVENEDTTRLVPPHQPVEGSRLRRISDGSLLTNKYKPSYAAIKYCLNYSYVELVLSLFIVAVFVNSAILIVAGSTLYGKPDAADADLLSIYEMLSYYISPAAGLVLHCQCCFRDKVLVLYALWQGKLSVKGLSIGH